LDHILDRLKRLSHRAKPVIATSTTAADDVVKEFCQKRGVACFRGDEANVLHRYRDCATRMAFTQIVRLTGDNPFVDIEELDRLIDLHFSANSDFAHSFGQLPLGVGAEIFTRQALERAARESTELHHFEHVDEYLLEHPEIFKTIQLEVPEAKRRPLLRLTVDTEEDWLRASFIAAQAGHDFVTTEEAIALCSRSA
jgi:spore coat polysaccharide biosynthesis protein SpsF